MRHIRKLIGVLCILLLTGCTSNEEETAFKQEEIVQKLSEGIQEGHKQEEQEEIAKGNIVSNNEEIGLEEEIVIDGVTYIIKTDYLSSLMNSSQLLKVEEDGERVVLDEGMSIQVMTRGSEFYTYVNKMVGEKSERYIKKYNGVTDDEGKSILEGVVNFKDNSIAIKGDSSGRGLWCVVEEQSNRVLILNKEDEVVFDKVLNPAPGEELRLEPYAWSYGSKYLWCLSLGTYNVEYYTIIDIESFEVTQIKKDQAYQDDYAIDCNNGWIAYSNMPVILDVDSREEFMASGKELVLYVENMFTKEKIAVDTSIKKAFNPKWLDKYTMQYDDPNGEGYLSYTLPLDGDLERLQEVIGILLESTEFLIECKEGTERLGEEKVKEITGSIIERLEEAGAILSTYEFHLKDAKFQEAVTYLEETVYMLLQETIIINEGNAQEARIDIYEIEGQVMETGHKACNIIDRTY